MDFNCDRNRTSLKLCPFRRIFKAELVVVVVGLFEVSL